MIELIKVNKEKAGEHLYGLANEADIFEISGVKVVNKICTQFALTQDYKYIVNTDSCDYYQYKKFDKSDILLIIKELRELANLMKEV